MAESANSSNQSAGLKENYGKKKRKIKRIGYAEGGLAGDEPEGLDDFLAESDSVQQPTNSGDLAPASPSNPTQSAPAPEGLDDFLAEGTDSNDYSEAFKAYGEGLGQGIAGPLSPMLESAAGVSNEGIRQRAEEHPYAHAAGEMTGLLSPISGPSMLASKVGGMALSTIGKAALANMTLGANDELTKLVEQDPNQSAQSAVAHIGLSGMLGGAAAGALGKVNQLWASANGRKAAQFLGSFKDKATEMLNGTPNTYDMTSNPSILADLNSGAGKAGAKMAEAAVGKLGDIGTATGATVGGMAGASIGGTPGALIGSQAGAKLFGPTFEKGLRAIAKPLINGDFNPEALTSTLSYLKSVDAGQKMMNQAAQNLFHPEKEVLKDSDLPSESDLDKLDKQIQSYGKNPESLTSIASNAQGYLPDHGQAVGQIGGAAVNYFNSIRPGGQEPTSPLDTKIKPSDSDMNQYRNQLMIGQQPLSIITKAKAGTVTPTDIKTLSAVYPDLWQGMNKQLTDAMITHISKGGTVPYKTRLGMSMLMAQPMDSTMTPAGIVAAQPVPQPQPANPNGKPPAASSVKGLKSLAKTSSTPNQAREMDKTSGEQ